MSPPARALALLACVTALLASGCVPGLRGDAARVTTVGDLEALTDRGWTSVGKGDTLAEGSDVRTNTLEARIELRRGEVWLGPGTRLTVHRDRVTVRAGDALVLSSGWLTGQWEDVEVRGDAAFRLNAGVTPGLAVYAGRVRVGTPGQQRSYPRLRQIALDSSRLAGEGDPLQYRTSDPWDRLLLAAAIAFDTEVGRLARGIDREYGTDPQPAEFYTSLGATGDALLPIVLESAPGARDRRLLGPPSDVLVTLLLARTVAARHDLDPARAAGEVAALRERGARWGLVAMEYDVTTGAFAAADLAAGPGTLRTGGDAGQRQGGAGTAAPTPPADIEAPGTPPPDGPPPPAPSPRIDPVQDIIDDVAGGVEGAAETLLPGR